MRSTILSIALILSVSVFAFAQNSANGTLTSVATSLENIETITLKYDGSNINTELATYQGSRLIIETQVNCICSEPVKNYLQGLYAPTTTINGGNTIIVAPKKATQPLYISGVETKYTITHKLIMPTAIYDEMLR